MCFNSTTSNMQQDSNDYVEMARLLRRIRKLKRANLLLTETVTQLEESVGFKDAEIERLAAVIRAIEEVVGI